MGTYDIVIAKHIVESGTSKPVKQKKRKVTKARIVEQGEWSSKASKAKEGKVKDL